MRSRRLVGRVFGRAQGHLRHVQASKHVGQETCTKINSFNSFSLNEEDKGDCSRIEEISLNLKMKS